MLYRKWRPQTFDQVVGQDHVVQTLRNALRSGRVAHAYLFTGPRGTGKTTCARLLAKAVNCLAEEPAARPCNECAICRAVNEGRLMDLIEIDAASNTGVDDVRELQERVGFRPAQARYKVYVIDEAHMLSKSAFNALLKTLEEPPPHVIFVLATTEPHRLPATIVSRCQRFAFRPIPAEAIAKHIARVAEAEGIEADLEALGLIARHAKGALRDALSLLEQVAINGVITAAQVREVLGLVPEEGLLAVLEAVTQGDVARALDALSVLLDEGVDANVVRQQLIGQLRDVLVAAAGVKQPGVSPRLETLAGAGVEKALRWLSALVETTPRGADDRTGLELALVRAVMGPKVPAALNPAAAPVVDAAPPRASRNSALPSSRPATRGGPARARRAGGQQSHRETGEHASGAEVGPVPAAPAVARELDALRERWDDLLAQARLTGNASIQALLRSCRPVAVDERHVVIETRYKFHQSRLQSDDTRRAVEQALASLIGEPVALQVVLADKRPEESSRASTNLPSRTAGHLPAGLPVELADDPLVRVAVEELGAVARVL